MKDAFPSSMDDDSSRGDQAVSMAKPLQPLQGKLVPLRTVQEAQAIETTGAIALDTAVLGDGADR